MSLANAAVVTAPSAFAPTGGTALSFTLMGSPVAGSAELAVTADTDFRTRRTLTMKVKPQSISLSAPNGYTQIRASGIFRKPKVLANGKITVNTIKVEIAYDPEATPTEIQELMDVGAQLLTDADFSPTFKIGSLS